MRDGDSRSGRWEREFVRAELIKGDDKVFIFESAGTCIVVVV